MDSELNNMVMDVINEWRKFENRNRQITVYKNKRIKRWERSYTIAEYETVQRKPWIKESGTIWQNDLLNTRTITNVTNIKRYEAEYENKGMWMNERQNRKMAEIKNRIDEWQLIGSVSSRWDKMEGVISVAIYKKP